MLYKTIVGTDQRRDIGESYGRRTEYGKTGEVIRIMRLISHFV
jgi:hypothetical protein